MDPVSLRLQAEPLILQALREDVTSEDVTTASVIGPEAVGRVQLIAKQDGVICGLDVFARTFELLDATATTELSVAEGDDVREGQVLGSVHAHVRALLSGERVALNYLQRMSGIATATRSMAALFAGTRTRLVDTRKTCPNMRVFEKEAVRVGGGGNHRYNLSDGVLLKDNHIDAAGGVMVREAVDAGADIIMLDNMDHELMREAMGIIAGRAEVEVSGNVDAAKAATLVDLGVDYVSSGALTHSAPILDLSLKHLTVEGR